MTAGPDPMALAFAVAQETTRRVLASLNMPTLRPATVSTWAHDSALALVTIDGDTDPIQALNATPVSLRPGDRVLVTLYPPAGVAVTGVLSGHRDPTIKATATASTYVFVSTTTTLAFGPLVGDLAVIVPFAGAVSPQIAGRYRVDATVRFEKPINGTCRTAIRRSFATDVTLDERAAPVTEGLDRVASFSVDLDLAMFETIEVRARQTSGATIVCSLEAFSMSRIGA